MTESNDCTPNKPSADSADSQNSDDEYVEISLDEFLGIGTEAQESS